MECIKSITPTLLYSKAANTVRRIAYSYCTRKISDSCGPEARPFVPKRRACAIRSKTIRVQVSLWCVGGTDGEWLERFLYEGVMAKKKMSVHSRVLQNLQCGLSRVKRRTRIFLRYLLRHMTLLCKVLARGARRLRSFALPAFFMHSVICRRRRSEPRFLRILPTRANICTKLR